MVRQSSQSGFTLVEMMVALFVFGLIASGAVMLLRFSVDAENSSRERLEEIADMRRFTAVLNADLAQAVPRTSRTIRDVRRGAFEIRDAQEPTLLMRLTRGGWTNFEETPRPSLQLVEYHLAGDRLERRTHAMLDGSSAGEGSLLMPGVTRVKLRFRDSRGVWSDNWEPELPESLPVAVEMLVESVRNGRAAAPIRLVVLVGANYQ
ncbi:type II secretion system minor pseudopilin GspJ [Sphingorhabdus sp. Alg239-R122]|uniref:type II secretion system minor pseudopilin GspJ n=1 Tax=Sphingorhabdus sp. Alg239-R122 TaxID=2305989 RepID=UPI0013D8E92B|nr:type II secretion system minor pseudopilin GspJ [Sphingorhabdus sp. Alg239-R122]